MASPKRPPRQAVRTVRLVCEAVADGVAVFCVTVSGSATYYTAREVLCEIGGRGFAIHKLGLGEVFHVRICGERDSTCECMGYLRHGYCRHVLGLRALIEAGKL
ncbi:MAG: hypothetical protein U0840_04815 [Gemmataceae bacterium]